MELIITLELIELIELIITIELMDRYRVDAFSSLTVSTKHSAL